MSLVPKQVSSLAATSIQRVELKFSCLGQIKSFLEILLLVWTSPMQSSPRLTRFQTIYSLTTARRFILPPLLSLALPHHFQGCVPPHPVRVRSLPRQNSPCLIHFPPLPLCRLFLCQNRHLPYPQPLRLCSFRRRHQCSLHLLHFLSLQSPQHLRQTGVTSAIPFGHSAPHGGIESSTSLLRKLLSFLVTASVSMLQEITQIVQKEVFTLTKRQHLTSDQLKRIIPCSLFLKAKLFPDGSFDKLKSRLFAGGHRQDVSVYENISYPTAK